MLLSLNIVLLVMGSFLEPPAAILILTPLLPPFGLNIFGGVFETPLGPIYRGVLPFVAINFLTLLIITYVPGISMVLLGSATNNDLTWVF